MRRIRIRAAIVIALFTMMCQHQRYAVLFAIVTPLLLAEPMAIAIKQKRALDWRRSTRVAILAVGIVGITFGAESLGWPAEDRTRAWAHKEDLRLGRHALSLC
jgi:hypothetical protein